eukprot:CAMPEP_0195526592 /NCGR_PEP_ID=MMETSP0794_2-20130614/27743_1 /TAXON_ID=515487 /ORGANISM="Stephanopyxis turris, Strain CCMP 815" /LENGTH=513 /DNA_ID=CAMNT_0040657319 /DNA_START=39 /DNA_END=1580 /DNA_ORIENTATION=+
MHADQQNETSSRSNLTDIVESPQDGFEIANSQDGGANVTDEPSFIKFFVQSSGPKHVAILLYFVALGSGSTIGVVPAVTTDRYARIDYGYDGAPCSSFDHDNIPQQCKSAASDAQNAITISMFVKNFITFFSCSLVGSISDERGRKVILTCGFFLSVLPTLALVLLQGINSMHPGWYYVAWTLMGFIDWFPVSLSAMSDVVPPKWRAPCFGLLVAGFMLGFSLAPLLAVRLTHQGVSILSLSFMIIAFLYALVCFPETLSKEVSDEMVALRLREQNEQSGGSCNGFLHTLIRPLKELSILNRNQLFRVLSVLAFSSGMVRAADQTLQVYYVENQLYFKDKDVALMFSIIGVLGVFVQGVILKPLNDCIGEKLILVIAFLFGFIYNFLFGIARTKVAVFIATAISAFAAMSFPTVSAIKANNVAEHEQGRVQGALYSLVSLSNALGPLSLQFVYNYTKDNKFPGPGTMFIFAAFLQLVAVALACILPKKKTDSRYLDNVDQDDAPQDMLRETLL